jgi:RNA polymerase sigma factor (sigma-70 family)
VGFDQPEFEALTRTFRPVLMRYFQRRTRSLHDAQDLTQEVFIRLARTNVADINTREAYIFNVAANLLRDKLRRERVRFTHQADAQAGDPGLDLLDPHRVAAGHEMLQALYAALAELPEKTRRIFTLYRIENVSKKTIAAEFGIGESAVEKQVTRAMAFLIDKLGEHLGDER